MVQGAPPHPRPACSANVWDAQTLVSLFSIPSPASPPTSIPSRSTTQVKRGSLSLPLPQPNNAQGAAPFHPCARAALLPANPNPNMALQSPSPSGIPHTPTPPPPEVNSASQRAAELSHRQSQHLNTAGCFSREQAPARQAPLLPPCRHGEAMTSCTLPTNLWPRTKSQTFQRLSTQQPGGPHALHASPWAAEG